MKCASSLQLCLKSKWLVEYRFCMFVVLILLIYFPCAIANNISFGISRIPLTTTAQKQRHISGGEGFQLVMAITYANSNPDIVYMGSNTSQIWKSVDGGEIWFPINSGYEAIGTCSLFVHPTNPNIVFSAGCTGKPAERLTTKKPYHGIIYTNNGGISWKMVKETPFFRQVSRGTLFAVDSNTINNRSFTIYAGGYDGSLIASYDSGLTWHTVATNFGPILEIVESPNSHGSIIIASEKGLFLFDGKNKVTLGKKLPTWPRSIAVSKSNPMLLYAALGRKGLYKSIDGGLSFKEVFGVVSGEINDIEVSPLDANIAVLMRSGSKPGPYYTNNGGKTWLKGETVEADKLTTGGGFYLPSPVAFRPNDKHVALTSSNGKARILATHNSGKSWTYSSSGYTGARLSDVIFQSSSKMIFCLTDHGAWATNDHAESFFQIDHPSKNGKSIGRGAISDATFLLTIGTWSDKYLMLSQDEGRTWNESKISGKIHYIKSHNSDSKLFYVDNYKTINGGYNWIKLAYKIRAVDPGNNNKVYAFKNIGKASQLMISTDSGDHWDKIGRKLPITAKSINKLEIDPHDTSRFYVASRYGLWVYKDGKWSRRTAEHGLLNDKFNQINFEAITAHPLQRGLLLTGRRSQGSGMANGLFYSTDHGESWKQMPGEMMSNMDIWSINVNPYDGIIYVGTSHGIYRIEKQTY